MTLDRLQHTGKTARPCKVQLAKADSRRQWIHFAEEVGIFVFATRTRPAPDIHQWIQRLHSSREK